MKAILGTALMIALGIAGVSLWGAVHAQRMTVSSSQIYIDGTPVCVMRQGGEIIASVGMCGVAGGESGEDGFGNGRGDHGWTLSPLQPHLGLPPGHPPVDSLPASEEERRILI